MFSIAIRRDWEVAQSVWYLLHLHDGINLDPYYKLGMFMVSAVLTLKDSLRIY